jgi:peptidoglycan L-alanyl-D-glutamate endopeptidase CwlK
LGLIDPPPFESIVDEVTVAAVGKMFPATPRANIERHLPTVLESLVSSQIADRMMVLMALATIRAETEAFKPISEGQSRFNTPPDGPPFALYDNRKDLGNMGAPDGSRFKGRGFIQLTGRTNYDRHGRLLGLGTQLLTEPDLANDAEIAARLLASFLKLQETAIRAALIDDDLKTARRLVNGGSHGLDRFTDAFRKGEELLPSEG